MDTGSREIFSKEAIEVADKNRKDIQCDYSLGKYKSKPQEK